MKKSIICFLIIFVCIGPTTTSAESPTADLANLPTHIGNLLQGSLGTSQEVLQTVKEYGLDTIAYTVAQKIGQKMVTKLINKASGGFDGDPQIVQNFGTIFSKIGEQQLDKYTTELLSSSNPFAKNIAKNMGFGGFGDALPTFTLDKVLPTGTDWKDAAENLGDAGEQGLAFYSQIALPQNNPIGSGLLAQKKLSLEIENKKAAEILKLTSSGFKPAAKCTQTIGQYKSMFSAGEDKEAIDLGAIQDSGGCVQEIINNPSALTSSLTSEASKFAIDSVKNINELGQFVGGLISTALTLVTEKGIGAIGAADYGQAKKGDVGGVEDLYDRGSSQKITNFAKAPLVIVDMRNNFEKGLIMTQQEIELLKTTRSELLKTPGKLAILDICLPGPDLIGLDNRLEKYYAKATGTLQRKSISGGSETKNSYRVQILSLLEKDYAIAKAEIKIDLIDDKKNIPGAGVMRGMINQFQSKKVAYQKVSDDFTTKSSALSQLNNIQNSLKTSITTLKQLEPKLSSVPDNLPFTKSEWEKLSQPVRDSLYTWATTKGSESTPLTTDDAKRDRVIKTAWDLWEYPYRFMADNKWSDEVAENSNHETEFITLKNKIRSDFNNIQSAISNEKSISQTEYILTAAQADNIKTDELIYDCDKMRILINGEAGTPQVYDYNAGIGHQEFLNILIANKDLYFKSDEVKNSLTLPSKLTEYMWQLPAECKPEIPYVAYCSGGPCSTGRHGASYNLGGVVHRCYGPFGYTNTPISPNEDDFEHWIDQASNAYQGRIYQGQISDLYWTGRIVKIIPDTSSNVGWKIIDQGGDRGLFCRFSSVLKMYWNFDSTGGGDVGMTCSSEWTDTSIGEALGSFFSAGL